LGVVGGFVLVVFGVGLGVLRSKKTCQKKKKNYLGSPLAQSSLSGDGVKPATPPKSPLPGKLDRGSCGTETLKKNSSSICGVTPREERESHKR